MNCFDYKAGELRYMVEKSAEVWKLAVKRLAMVAVLMLTACSGSVNRSDGADSVEQSVSAVPIGEKSALRVTFTTRTHDFGAVKEAAGEVSCRFEFENTGDKPLVVTRTATSCECTLARHSTKPVKPGEKGEIEVLYSPIGVRGKFMKCVYVYFSGTSQPVTLVVKGRVIPAM